MGTSTGKSRMIFLTISFVLSVSFIAAPTLARFVQPDQTIPDTYNPQSLNRYAYSLNNPYKYTDPTGNEPVRSDMGSYRVIVEALKTFEQMPQNKGLNSQQILNNFAMQGGNSGNINLGGARYIYTSDAGIVDMTHFFSNARNSWVPEGVMQFVDVLFENLQGLFESTAESSFSYEDLKSNKLGRDFGRSMTGQSGELASDKLEKWAEGVGASTNPENDIKNDYPGLWEFIPASFKEATHGKVLPENKRSYVYTGKAIPDEFKIKVGVPIARK